MFTVYCERHGADVLLSCDNIVAVSNDADGILFDWECACGQIGQMTSHDAVAA
jgi:hypothetical protein